MIWCKWLNTVLKEKYKYAFIDLWLINSSHINQRKQITYHSIISFILKNIKYSLLFLLSILYFFIKLYQYSKNCLTSN